MKTLTYNPGGGCHILAACTEAVKLATTKDALVDFKFNDIDLRAAPNSEPSTLAEQYSAECEKRREAYQKSAAGIAAARAQEDRLIRAQACVCGLVATLADVLREKPLPVVMAWLDDFTTHADHIGVEYDRTEVATIFEQAGYKSDEGVGNPPEWFNTQERMGRYIIGQAINCLRMGMGPHPITHSFIEKFNALAV